MKICSVCGIEQDDECFRKGHLRCRSCVKKYNKEYREKNAENIKKSKKKYRETHQEEIKISKKIYYENNKESYRIRHMIYYKNNKEDLKEYNKQYYEDHQEERIAYTKEYCKNNKEQVRNRQNKRQKEKRKNDPVFKLRQDVSHSINKHLSKNNSSKNGNATFDCLPYTPEQLRDHLEKQFQEPGNEWMNWENRGLYKPKQWNDDDPTTWKWQLDHIQPQSDFPFTSMKDENCQKCWALSNLRPYSAKQNLLDGNRRKKEEKEETNKREQKDKKVE